MVIAGQAGGKSTFIGTLATYVSDIEGGRWQGNYQVEYGSESTFRDKVYGRVANMRTYPEPTDDPGTYLVRVQSRTDSQYAAQRDLTMMDIPGERQEDNTIERLLSGDWTESEVREAYEEGIPEKLTRRQKRNRTGPDSIRKRIEQGRRLVDVEEEMLYIYQYLAANRVILLLNLFKFTERFDKYPQTLSDEVVRKVASDKRCLVLVTAADVVDYDPSQFRSGILSSVGSALVGSPRMYDRRLDDHLHETNLLPPGRPGNEVLSIVDAARENDASMFSVAVPESPGGDIEIDGQHVRTPGFENVAEWLFDS